jgi:hypothetical protein
MRIEDWVMTEKWVVLYSAKQDAYHVETEYDFLSSGPGDGDYRVVDAADNMADAVRKGSERRQRGLDK